MTDTINMKTPPAQGVVIKEIHRSKQQNLERDRFAATRRRKRKKKKLDEKFANSRERQAQHRDSKKTGGQKKDSKARGSLLDIVI